MASPYRIVGRPPVVSAFGGRDEARLPIVLWGLLLLPLVPFSSRVGLSFATVALGLACAGALLHVADRKSRRYSLRISAKGYILRRYRFFFLRTATFRASLDWEPFLTDEWDDFDPAGFSFSAPKWLQLARHTRPPKSPTFGPVRETKKERAVLEQMKVAVSYYRSVVSRHDKHREQKRRSGDLRALFHRADPNSVEYGPWGRVSSLTLSREAKLDSLALPPGTKVEFGYAGQFQAPSTKDLVTHVTLGAPLFVEALSARVRPRARLTLDERRRISQVERPFVRDTVVHGVLMEGKGSVWLDEKGRITGCILGEPIKWGKLTLAAGTRVSVYYRYHIALQGPGIRVDDLPDVRPGYVRASLTSWGKRSSLADLLKRPRGRVEAIVHLCIHPAGVAAGPKDHKTVALWG